MPSWLSSAIVHLVAIIVLAWWTVSDRLPRTPLVSLLAGDAAAMEAIEDSTEWVQPLETPDEVQVNVPDAAASLGQDSTAPVLEAASSGESVALDLVASSSLEQIGTLFVAGGGGMRSSEGVSLKKEAMFYGVKARGNRFVFIVDSSNSMRGGKFEDAKRELLYAIRRLSKDQYFYVIFFDADAERMVLDDGPDALPAAKMAPATGENMLRLERWVATVQNELKTNPFDAVEFAMQLSPDAVYLLTDGKFTDKGRTVRYLARENFRKDDLGRREVKVVFHTIGFHSRDGEDVLKEIAQKYKGTYQFVAPPNVKNKR